ncbi:MAG: tRNA(Ile)-lysidine synthase [Nitrospinales bacterium]|jgi:tRNA(Ile)-lysidine synthase
MTSFLKNIEQVLKGLIAPGDKVLVGVSGGTDSIVLLHVLHWFSRIQNYSLIVVHINHMARGKDSDADANFVESVAEKFKLPFYLKKIDVGVERLKLKTSFQDAARIIRYNFFEETLRAVGGNKVALGHSADDQVETILMNIVRGTGLKGLAGIPQVRGFIIRPFWGIHRKDLDIYLKENDISFRDDSSNSDKKYLRNRIRHELIPHLESYNPSIKKSLQEMSGIAREEDSLLSQMTKDIFNQKLGECSEKNIVWEIEDFQIYPIALRQRLVREIFCRMTGDMQAITAYHVQQIINLFNSPKAGKILNISRGVTVTCSYETVLFSKVIGGICENEPLVTPIVVPGTTELLEGHIRRVETQIFSDKRDLSSLDTGRQAFFDLEKTGFSIQARFFRAGDRFCPLGMTGNKKLKSFFIDQKVPQSMRSQIPILTNADDDIIWVYGQRISHPYRVTDKTEKVLFIEGDKAIKY